MLYRADSKIDEVEILLMKGKHYLIDCYNEQDPTVIKPERANLFIDCPIIIDAMKHIGTTEGQEIDLENSRLTDYTFVHKLILDTLKDKASLALRGYEKQITIKYIMT